MTLQSQTPVIKNELSCVCVCVVFFPGLHYDLEMKRELCSPEERYKKALHKLGKLFRELSAQNTDKVIIARSTLPQHFDNHGIYPDGYYKHFDGNFTRRCTEKSNWHEHRNNALLKQVSDVYGFHYLNSAALYAERWDKHEPRDCTHYCVEPETSFAEMQLICQIIHKHRKNENKKL